MFYRVFLRSALLLLIPFLAQVASAAGTVRLELVGEPRGAALAFQDWGKALDRAGISNVRFRTSDELFMPIIETQGNPEHPTYIVRGRVVSAQELLLPGIKIKRSELGKLKQWLADLAEQGPPEGRPEKAAFGLTHPQFTAVKADLTRPVAFSTRGLPRREAVEKIARQLKNPLQSGEDIARVLEHEKIEDELLGLTSGTALACLLRPAGFGLAPQADRGRITYMIVRLQPNSAETWPAGWTPEQPVPKLLPDLYRDGNVDIQNYAVTASMEAVGKRIKIPVLYDRLALARQRIDPAQTRVSVPPSRLTFNTAIKKLLGQAGLKYEIRADEAGSPFFWITSARASLPGN